MRNPLKGIFNFIKDKIIAIKIIRIAMRGGYDLDGDFIVYKGRSYYVNALEKTVIEVLKGI